MSREPEYLVVAVSPRNPEMKTPVLERLARFDLESQAELFERAKKRQSWLKFERGYRGSFIYECFPMDYVNGEFVSTVPYQGAPQPETENEIIRAQVVEALLERGYSVEQIARLEELGSLDVE